MTSEVIAKKIAKILDEYFPDPPVPLDHKDPFTLLIAVLLSARCTDKRVNLVTPQLFHLADTPQKMSKISLETIQEIIRPCGLSPQKAKAISSLSKDIISLHRGTVPCNFEALEALPGVGHKTASVVMSQAFGHPAFPVDTHIQRLAKRWGLSEGKNVKQIEADLKKAFPKKSWNKIHLQMIYFGRNYCPARRHSPKNCPICSRLARNSQAFPSRAGQESVKYESAQFFSGDGVLKHVEVDKNEQTRSLPAIGSRNRNKLKKCGLALKITKKLAKS